MIYLFTGTDSEKTRSQAFAFVQAARNKEPQLSYVRLSREELTSGTLDEITHAGGLFVKRLLVLLDEPFSTKGEDDEGDSTSTIDEHLDALAASDNAVVILAPKMPAAKAKVLAKLAKKTYEFNAARKEEWKGFNSALVNALGAKDSAKLWLEIVRAIKAGDAPEAVHGLLHWKARDLMQKGGRGWDSASARKLSIDLIALLQRSRRTGEELSTSLERFALSI